MPETGPLLSLRDIYKIYTMGESEVFALNGISLTIEKGEFVSIMGPSGSGKSTCMHIIGCLDHPTSGDIFISGKNTSQMNAKELAVLRNKTVGFVFQQYNLISNMTVLENVMLPLRYQGLSISERKARAVEVLERIGLSDRLKHTPGELSGGQKQRTAIARATVTNPELILADEPTGALDSETGNSVIDLFHDINKNGTTILIVTHDQDIGNTAPRRIHLRDGKITEDSCV
ncbi:ABC transporter ATP-binding protein [Brucepastera parasyntrophica]|uniref:ABC transporter ATP-binding protein n=1 Tax=Brucepastera parasyntrophica TaxID=2880008 RepID=UPI00210CB471|nr:ABC transporter ATP-binding protein [Brucepastera parasyntrophica]ULQ61150.1 ABC transporter ATP-binding protein [Brucepastera parasyntrophica]